MSYWLMKSEPSVFSIEDLRAQPAGTAGWDGVRNYQARNNLRAMRRGDLALFYHSSAVPTGVAGLMEIVRTAYPDPTQFDEKSPHFEPRASPERPVWLQVDVRFVRAFTRVLAAAELKAVPELGDMLLFRSPRLSVQSVSEAEWRDVLKLAESRAGRSEL